MRRSPLVRSAWLVFAALQLALPGAAALADARLDIAGAHARPHIESHSTSACARVHPADCALCRFLTSPIVPGAPAKLLSCRTLIRAPLAPSHRTSAAAVALLPRSRAPPTPA